MVPWENIKNYWREEFCQTEVYTDENEHIIIFKNNNTFIILGYFHYQDCFWMSAREHIDFIDFIKKLGMESYNPFKIYLLCNCKLSKIKKPNDIFSLPNDVEYYYVDYNSIFNTIEFKLENKIESARHSQNWQEIMMPWHHKKGIPVITDSRFEDWNKWSDQGYTREWYDWNEDERFDYFYYQMVLARLEWYIDDSRLNGFYIVWKW